jgi:hypothetical protein
VKRYFGSIPRAVIGAGVLLFVGTGCGRSDGLATVTGMVRLDGKPLAGAQVQFTLEGQPPSYGRTDANGYYEMRRTRAVSGAPIGTNRVMVRTFRDLGNRILPETLPARYNTRSQLVYDVKAGSNRIDLELTSH